jgi:cytochrome c oxidase subunit 2
MTLSPLTALTLFAEGEATLWFPPASTDIAKKVDDIFYFIYWVSVIFFVGIVAAMILFVVKYRRKSPTDIPVGPTHNTPLEITWTVIPLALAMLIFWKGFAGYLELIVPPQDAYQVRVTGQQWKWMFTYPNGMTLYGDKLVVPAGKSVRLVMTSEDVIHSFFVPDFRIKQDVVPGRYSTVWFNTPDPGEHDVFCTEYCGKDHSNMLAKVIVVPPADLEKTIAIEGDVFKMKEFNYDDKGVPYKLDDPKVKQVVDKKVGEFLYNTRGCKSCHSIDGSRVIGPSFKGIWGKEEEVVEDGATHKVKVDDNYVRESIMDPQKKIVVSYPPVMPTFKGRLTDKEITALIEYIQSLKE